MPNQTSENRSKHFCEEQKSSGQMSWTLLLPYNASTYSKQHAKTVAAENEREAKSSTGTSRSARACANRCEELGLEDVNRFLNLPAQSSTRFSLPQTCTINACYHDM